MSSTASPRAIGVFGGGALLVRPDGAPIALWHTDHLATELLRAAVRTVTGLPGVSAADERDVA